MTKKARSVIIGLGRIASLLEEDALREKPCTHAGAISANPDCVLAGGCDIDEERRRLFAERWNTPVYHDAGEMIRAQNPDMVVIATHPDSHYHYCRLAAASGVPVIVCEKPLADTFAAAKKIAALAGNGGPIIITSHERRYSADYMQAREILGSEKLGTILSARAILYMGKNKRLLDVLWHDGTHLADALMFLSGSILKHRKSHGAKLKSSDGTAWLEGELHKENNTAIPVLIETGAGRDHLVFELDFSCAKGRLRIGNGIFEVWESAESPYAEKFRSLKLTTENFNRPTGYFANMMADAAACIREPGRKPVSSAADGLRVIEYLHSVKAWR
jgi:predicted dehydrogenase